MHALHHPYASHMHPIPHWCTQIDSGQSHLYKYETQEPCPYCSTKSQYPSPPLKSSLKHWKSPSPECPHQICWYSPSPEHSHQPLTKHKGFSIRHKQICPLHLCLLMLGQRWTQSLWLCQRHYMGWKTHLCPTNQQQLGHLHWTGTHLPQLAITQKLHWHPSQYHNINEPWTMKQLDWGDNQVRLQNAKG